MIAAQLIIYLLVFTLMVKIAVMGNALNGIYFYPREVQKRAVEIGLIDETMMSIKKGLLNNPKMKSQTLSQNGKGLLFLFEMLKFQAASTRKPAAPFGHWCSGLS